MRHVLRSIALVPFLLAGCNDGAGPLSVDVAYQLTCSGTPPNACMPAMISGASWDYVQKNGKEVVDGLGNSLGTVEARCSASHVSDGVLQLSMRTELAGDYLEIEGLRLDSDTGTFVGGPCRVSVYDGDNLYGGSTLGACSGEPPTTATPCQVSAASINRSAPDGPLVELRMNCATLPNTSNPTSQVSLRDAQAAGNPAIVRFTNCRGI